jgi:simple sugar transport system ATP-binding protein
VRQLAGSFGLPVDPNLQVQNASVGLQQRVEILKTLQRNAKILILDEPTAVLTPQEVKELYAVVRRLADDGRAVILITHKLPEVKAVADRLTVMRRGRVVSTDEVKNVTVRQIASTMVGREVILKVEKGQAHPGDVVLEIENLLVADNSGLPAVLGVNLQVHAGEILGIAGVSGNGQTELVEAIAGLRPVDGGRIRLLGKEITDLPVRDRRDAGLAHIPEDRMSVGLNLQTNLDENVIVTTYDQEPYSERGILQRNPIQTLAQKLVNTFSIKSARVGEEIRTLSGGNLQKIVLGRELEGTPRFIIANQPTRGVDVGSIEFVHQTLVNVRDQGVAILLVSVELDEILALSDRILVIYEGQMTAEFDVDAVTEEELGIAMAGGKLDDSHPVAAAPLEGQEA